METGGASRRRVPTDRIDWRGAALRQLEPGEFSAIGVPADTRGVLVIRCPEKSAAFGAGLRESDLIRSVNDGAVSNAREFARAVKTTPGGRPVKLAIVRDQQPVELELKPRPVLSR